MHATRTWILIADSAHADAYLSLRPGEPLQRISDFHFQDDVPRASELHRHAPGTGHTGVGSARHSVGPVSDPRREAKRGFAHRVCEALEEARAAERFDRLVLACPPTMLGDLRAAMPAPLAATVIAETAKNLVKTPEHELLAHFADVPALSR